MGRYRLTHNMDGRSASLLLLALIVQCVAALPQDSPAQDPWLQILNGAPAGEDNQQLIVEPEYQLQARTDQEYQLQERQEQEPVQEIQQVQPRRPPPAQPPFQRRPQRPPQRFPNRGHQPQH